MQSRSENQTDDLTHVALRREMRSRVGLFDIRRTLIACLGPGVVVIASLGSSMWIAHTHTFQMEQQLHDEARTAANAVGTAVEPLIALDDTASVRSVVSNAAHSEWVTHITVSLPDGRTVADSVETPDVELMPAVWERRPLVPVTLTTSETGVRASTTLIVPHRGSVLITVHAAVPARMSATPMLTGIWVFASLATVAITLVQRTACKKQRGIKAVWSALQTVGDRGVDPDALRIHPGLGAEAGAWNTIVARLQRLDDEDVASRAAMALSSAAVEHRIAVSACSAIPIGLIVVDAEMRVQLQNGAGANLLGLSTRSETSATLGPNNAPQQLLDAVRGLINGDRVHSTLEVEQDNNGGKGMLRVVARRVPQSNPTLVVALIEDVTQQRIAQQSREVFVAQATHELRTPLTNIRLYAESMLEDTSTDQSARDQAVNVINRESRRLERIVNDMLSVSEMDSGSYTLHRDDVRTDQLLAEIETDYEAQARDKGITLEFNLPPKLPVLLGERDKLAMAIHNLVGNALKYTPDGGSVTVEVLSDPNQLVISVSDSGIGISEEMLPRVFDRFYRAQDDRVSKTTGSGLGLALAREVVRLHGGEITAESVLNEGSTFKIILPVLAQAA